LSRTDKNIGAASEAFLPQSRSRQAETTIDDKVCTSHITTRIASKKHVCLQVSDQL
jgi:hypothetical protein